MDLVKTKIEREFVQTLYKRVAEEGRLLIQVVLGPRQVGKTTGVKQLIEKIKKEELNTTTLYSSADAAAVQGDSWILEQ